MALSDWPNSTKSAGVNAIISAIISVVAGILYIFVQILQAINEPDPSNGKYQQAYLVKLWANRNNYVNYQISLSFFQLVAFILFVQIFRVVKKIHSQERGVLNQIQSQSFIVAAGISIINFFIISGLNSFSRLMSKRNSGDSDADYHTQLVALSIAYDLISGTLVFLFTFSSFLLAIATFSIGWMTMTAKGPTENTLNKKHGVFALILSIGFFILFIIGMVLFMIPEDYNSATIIVSIIYGFLALFVFYVLFPIWLITLGIQLFKKKIPTRTAMSTNTEEMSNATTTDRKDVDIES